VDIGKKIWRYGETEMQTWKILRWRDGETENGKNGEKKTCKGGKMEIRRWRDEKWSEVEMEYWGDEKMEVW
jgi:hypothetical protein